MENFQQNSLQANFPARAGKSLCLNIATVNGTGSLSANQLLSRMLFRSGWPLGCYNFFPSNIAGLPCLYNIRLNSEGWRAFDPVCDILVSLNPKTLSKDLKDLKPGGVLATDEKDKAEKALAGERLPESRPFLHIPFPFTRSLLALKGLSLKTRPLLRNILYVGLLAEWLQIDGETSQKAVEDFFGAGGGLGSKSQEIWEQNLKVFEMGRAMGKENPLPFPVPQKPGLSNGREGLSRADSRGGRRQKIQNQEKEGAAGQAAKRGKLAAGPPESQSPGTPPGTSPGNPPGTPPGTFSGNFREKPILIDGNAGVALGALFSGCQLLSWYPITPATSIAENFEKFAGHCQRDAQGKKKFAVIQAEDEIAALGQVIGAGWAGIRAMTTTSGPGLSLMGEGAGLAYFSETPAVLCNVQRAGPSTGLPTRTQQADLLAACFLSHGDSSHVVLLPGNPEECFSLTQKAFDLAEELQTLVIILSDLDLGMNLRPSVVFKPRPGPLRRGKVIGAKELASEQFADFGRYRDPDGDGVSYRALPGARHEKAGYLARGSGHNEKAEYSEAPEDYAGKLDKLKRKSAAAKKMMPEPVIEISEKANLAFVTFGSNEEAVRELMAILKRERGLSASFMRLRSFPFPKRAESFLEKHLKIFVVEQNRDGQMKKLLSGEFPSEARKMKSILQYDGRPLSIRHIKKSFLQSAGEAK